MIKDWLTKYLIELFQSGNQLVIRKCEAMVPRVEELKQNLYHVFLKVPGNEAEYITMFASKAGVVGNSRNQFFELSGNLLKVDPNVALADKSHDL